MDNELLKAQQAYEPRISGLPAAASSVVVCGGMGGSALPADALRFLSVVPHVIAHRDYGLPMSVPEGAHYVALSYSGDTEEALSFAHEALAQGHALSVIASGGRLLALAQDRGLTHVEVPSGFVPRDALLFMTKALLALIGEEHRADDMAFDADAAARAGSELASFVGASTPVFYASARNELAARIAKIFMNETAKRPAFANVVPELNHNEMQGFVQGKNADYVAVFLEDASDGERLQRRMALTEEVLRNEDMRTRRIALPHAHRIETLLYAWWLSREAARSLSREDGINPDGTPLIDAFKRAL